MIFTCTNFAGHWPVGTAAVIIAFDEKQAKDLLLSTLAHQGLGQTLEQAARLEFVKINSTKVEAHILCDGNY